MSVSLQTNAFSNLTRTCGTLAPATQQNLRSQLQELNQLLGLDQLFGSSFQQGGMQAQSAQLQGAQWNFGQPGQIPQPGQLLSLRHTEVSQGFSAFGVGMPSAGTGQAPAQPAAQQRPPLDWYIDKFGGAQRFGHADYFAAVKDGYSNAEILDWMKSKNFNPSVIGQELAAEVRAGKVDPNKITNGRGLHDYRGMGQFGNAPAATANNAAPAPQAPATQALGGMGASQFAQALQLALLQQVAAMTLMPASMNWLSGDMSGLGRMNGLGGMGGPGLARMDLAQAFGGAGNCFGSFGQQMGALGGLERVLQAQLGLGALAQQGRQDAMGGMGNLQNTTVGQGQPAQFPPAKRSAFLEGLKNPAANAKALNVSGSKDVQRINKAITQLNTAQPKAALAKPGEKSGAGKLVLSQEQVAAIRNAPDQKAAEAIVRQAIEQSTGKKLGTANMNDKKAIRNGANREAMNALLGTKVKAGVEKNSGSSLVLNEMISGIANSVRGGSFGTTQVSHDYARAALGEGCLSAFGMFRAGNVTAEFANGPQAMSFDLGDYAKAAQSVAELASPLIFDLEGQGLKLKNGGMIDIDIDGDGKVERVTELDAHLGLLVFDSKFVPEEGEGYAAGRDMFGDGTDLSAYGIRGPKDNGTFENGFDALRALVERFELVHGDKQHLDESDLVFLEREVGLAMRVGGVAEGEDQSFATLGITRIALGDPNAIQPIEESEKDRYGNRYMRQKGATFVVNAQTRDYCDIWFNIQARANVSDFADDKREITTSGLLAMHRRV